MPTQKELENLYRSLVNFEKEFKRALQGDDPKEAVKVLHQFREVKNEPMFADVRKSIAKDRMAKRRGNPFLPKN